MTAFNCHKLGRLKYVIERSLTKTLARSNRISVPQVYRRDRAVLDTEHGPRRGLQVTGGPGRETAAGRAMGRHLPVTRRHPAAPQDDPARIWSHRSEIAQRLMAMSANL